LRVIKGTHCNLPRPESPNPKKYVSLLVQKTTFPGEGTEHQMSLLSALRGVVLSVQYM
jgi:hypothetical protein